ncbi:hypothetical protein BDF21DRAFT_432132 [Thamnidium elegans]|uniref:SH3 domain-containing protein n=1 Tax=Thamnidium elegans TaxID=101142 RepID=A0A8H7SKD2_9FUNG|nr:hypothetical protein INT48_003975 [Thamnidium elegans]KAI8051787.1 hypothetical protein BDF21DRAFT_432132 [Thamnidium elegans]
MPTTTKDARRLTGYNDNAQPLYDDDMEEYQHYTHNDVYDEYDEDLDDVLGNKSLRDDDEDDIDDDTGSELSIPDPNIDFDMVYALHTFAATVEGQASVVRGDALTLLDDSNSYWWLVKVLKTAEVGYIPAENIETPHERLARLNSHRNIELTRKDIQDAFPTPPSNKIKKTKRVTLAKGVQFQSQIIFGSSDDDDEDFFESQFEQWDERMQSDETDSDADSDDPYNYYDHASSIRQTYAEPIDMYTPYKHDEYYNEERLSGDSDIINDREPNRDTLSLDEETIKISLTPSIARDDHNNSTANKAKKASKLEKLLGSSDSDNHQQQERRGSKDSNNSKKEKSGIRKFFSRNSKIKTDQHRSSGGSQYETASISSQSTGISSIVDRDRSGSLDSTMQQQQHPQQGTELKIHAGNINHFINSTGLVESYKFVTVYASTTATELIHLSLQDQDQLHDQDMTYHDFYLIVRTLGGDEFTLVPSDKPLEIFHSLTAHLNTPMPSLKKARRISQLMGSDNATHIGGPNKDMVNDEEQVQFYLLSKTKRIDDGEIQIKVSLYPSQQQQHDMKRVDKLVKIPSTILIKDAVTLLLEKFHILNGVAAGLNNTDIKSLRLEEGSEQDIVKYHLAVNKDGQEHLLDLEEKLFNVFSDDQIPHIHYRRNSNPDRTSITVNITPPEKNEIFFILKCVESKKREDSTKPKPIRQDTPLPRKAHTPTHGFEAEENYLPQVILSDEPVEMETDSILSQLDEAIDTLNNKPNRVRPESTESMLYCNDFGMNDLMVIIRGAAIVTDHNKSIRSEISEVFKDSHTRLDQLEKELDRLMSEAVKVYH